MDNGTEKKASYVSILQRKFFFLEKLFQVMQVFYFEMLAWNLLVEGS